MRRLDRRRALLGAAAAGAAILQGCAASRAQQPANGRHYVLVHGAWHGAWAWNRVSPLLRDAGHTVSTPTLSGLGERAHHAPGRCGLSVHVRDIVQHLEMEDLRQVVLVGHSYAGCVVSGVLAARTGRVGHAVYLDAFALRRGEALATFVPPEVRKRYEALAAQDGLVPPPPQATWAERWGMSDPALRDWAGARITPQAAASFVETVAGDPAADAGVLWSYLKCARNPNPGFLAQAARAKQDGRFRYAQLDAHHNAMVMQPRELVQALLALG